MKRRLGENEKRSLVLYIETVMKPRYVLLARRRARSNIEERSFLRSMRRKSVERFPMLMMEHDDTYIAVL